MATEGGKWEERWEEYCTGLGGRREGYREREAEKVAGPAPDEISGYGNRSIVTC
jgi:hypothetical protein